MYSNIKKDIASPDLAFVNQESPLGGDDIPYSGFKRFNTPSQVASDIVATGFDVINGANNHSLDRKSRIKIIYRLGKNLIVTYCLQGYTIRKRGESCTYHF